MPLKAAKQSLMANHCGDIQAKSTELGFKWCSHVFWTEPMACTLVGSEPRMVRTVRCIPLENGFHMRNVPSMLYFSCFLTGKGKLRADTPFVTVTKERHFCSHKLYTGSLVMTLIPFLAPFLTLRKW